jgi:hypothetical protein
MRDRSKSRRAALAAVLATLAVLLSGCSFASDADKASENVSTAADNFEVNRLIVGINLRSGEILFSAEGACSMQRDPDALVVICKESGTPPTFKKHYFGLAEGVTYVSTQLEPVVASVYHTRIILKPQNIVPNLDLSVGHDG